MDDIYLKALANLGVSLTELAVKSTATMLTTKINAIKDEKIVIRHAIFIMKL